VVVDAPSGPGSAIGLRAKTGRAIAVLLTGTRASPEARRRCEIVLATPALPALYQPFHWVMDLPWQEAAAAVDAARRALEAAAASELGTLLRALQPDVSGGVAIGLVGAPERNLAAIASPHIRAHAAEGVLFRRVWQVGAASNTLACSAFPERDIEAQASRALGLAPADIRTRLERFGRILGRPWRADEKAAALAAWMVLP
jgi:hypothetical protein